MGKKSTKSMKSEILSINLTDGKKSGIRKKIQGKVTKTTIESYNQFADEWGFNSRDELFNAVLDLTLRYCAPLPTDDVFTADMTIIFNKFFCRVEDIEVYSQEQKGVVVGFSRRELKLYFLFMLQPFSDARIKKDEWSKRNYLLKKYNYGKTTFQIINFILSNLLTIDRLWRVLREKDRISKTINEQFENIVVETKEMGTKLGRNI